HCSVDRSTQAQRKKKTTDQKKTSNNTIHQLAKGAFVGVQTGTNTSGPNGVITANDHTEVWAADGVLCVTPAQNNACATGATRATQTSRILVIDLATGQLK